MYRTVSPEARHSSFFPFFLFSTTTHRLLHGHCGFNVHGRSAEGRNGRLPNLDLVHTVLRVGDKLGVPITVSNFGWRFMWQQLGLAKWSQPPHSPLLDCHIESLTVRTASTPGTVSVEQHAWLLLAGALRSLNNLEEHLHQSHWFYIMTGPRSFVPLGVYVIPGLLLVLPFVLAGWQMAVTGPVLALVPGLVIAWAWLVALAVVALSAMAPLCTFFTPFLLGFGILYLPMVSPGRGDHVALTLQCHGCLSALTIGLWLSVLVALNLPAAAITAAAAAIPLTVLPWLSHLHRRWPTLCGVFMLAALQHLHANSSAGWHLQVSCGLLATLSLASALTANQQPP